jgi:hypothetical protein
MTRLESARAARDALRITLEYSGVKHVAIDAFAASERELLLAELAGEQSPEVARAEVILRTWAGMLFLDGRAGTCSVIAAELDRLRAENATLRNFVDALNVCHFCGDVLVPHLWAPCPTNVTGGACTCCPTKRAATKREERR